MTTKNTSAKKGAAASQKKKPEENKKTLMPETASVVEDGAGEAKVPAPESSVTKNETQPAEGSAGGSAEGDAPASKGEYKDAPEVDRMIVSSKIDGFRRAGRAWSMAATIAFIDDFTEEQINTLLSEPLLDVSFIQKGAEL